MKNIFISLAAVIVLSSTANADAMTVFTPDSSVSGIYVGIAYSNIENNTMFTYTDINPTIFGNTVSKHDAAMFQLGYQMNKYLSFEGRYWMASSNEIVSILGDNIGTIAADTNVDYDAWGIYVKPIYPLSEKFSVYALLGYGNTNYDITYKDDNNNNVDVHGLDDSGFSWGFGATYATKTNLAFFVDYTRIYDGNTKVTVDSYQVSTHTAIADIKSDAFNFGVNYKF